MILTGLIFLFILSAQVQAQTWSPAEKEVLLEIDDCNRVYKEENLDVEIEQYSLHAWEPALALEVWNHLYRCYGILRGAEEEAQDGLEERARRVVAKILQIDVTQALKAARLPSVWKEATSW